MSLKDKLRYNRFFKFGIYFIIMMGIQLIRHPKLFDVQSASFDALIFAIVMTLIDLALNEKVPIYFDKAKLNLVKKEMEKSGALELRSKNGKTFYGLKKSRWPNDRARIEVTEYTACLKVPESVHAYYLRMINEL